MIDSVTEIVRLFGGNTKMAERYGVLPSAISNWKAAGRFPARLHYRISQDAAALGIEVSPAIFDAPSQDTAQAKAS